MKKHLQPLTPVALYARVSSDRQDVDLSVSAQLRALKDYAKANGYSVAREYVDEAESSRVADRPQFREMIEEGSKPNAPFEIILVWKFSRFTRKREYAVAFKSMLRMMGVASLLEDGIELSFADGSKGLIPYADVPEIRKRAAVSSLELPSPYEMILETDQGEKVEIPWDFARHYCDASYRPTVEAIAMRGRQTLGQRIRQSRESAGLTQEALATAAGIGRVTLVRLEKGEQTPRFKFLDSIAQALGIRVSELLVEPELLVQ